MDLKIGSFAKLTLIVLGLSRPDLAMGQSYGDDAMPSGPSPSDVSAKSSEEDDDNVIRKPKEAETPPPRQFSKTETQAACAKFKGKLISVYGEIYKLQNCVRHLMTDQDEVFELTRQGTPIVEVESKDVAALPIGKTWDVLTAKERPCSAFNKRYVTFSYTDIYYVENCVRRLIPDYETLVEHRRATGQKSSEVLALTEKEFHAIRQGRDITSIIDKEFGKLLEGTAGVDIIPVNEACKGVEGKIVTFYSRMYKIEKCRKREIDPEAYTMQRRLGDARFIELRPEQWVSMPDGKPYTGK